MQIIKNDYKYKEVRTYLNKVVIEITPIGVTPPNSEDYPMYVYRDIDDVFEDVVEDLSSK